VVLRYSEADAGPGAEAGAGFRDYKNSFGSICVAASVRPGQAEFTSARRWALALRPEHHPRSDQSGHVEQPACVQDTLSEGTARAAQLAPSAVTASAVGGSATSRNLPPVWLPTLSDDERLVEEHARSRGVEEPLVVGESRQPHFWWQILRDSATLKRGAPQAP
jgi:hypothetical protein